MSLVLYHYWRSSASWRARWALELKGVKADLRHTDILIGEEKKPEYLKQNPAGYVPCLVDGDFVLSESIAIMEWLEEKHPSPSLFTGDANLRAKIRQLAETLNAGTQPLQNPDVWKKITSDKAAQDEWIQFWATRGLRVCESLLEKSQPKGAKFCFGDAPTIADLCLIPQCYSSVRFKVDLSAFPRCKAVYEHALTTEACKRSHPEKYQPAQA